MNNIWNHILKNKNIIILSFIWLFLFLLVAPYGNFPINDDFLYAKTIKILCEKHSYQVIEYGKFKPLITNVLYGWFACSIFGFSHFVLRLTTIIISFISIIYFYKLSNIYIKNSKVAFFSTLIYALNPLFFNLSYSFMTDVPFISLVVISFYYFLQYTNKQNSKYFLFALATSLMATMIRQIGIILPISFFVAYIFVLNKNNRILFYLGLLSCINLFAYILVKSLIYKFFPNTYSVDTSVLSVYKAITLPMIFWNYSVVVFFMGIFLIPLNVLFIDSVFTIKSKIFLIAFVFIIPLFFFDNYVIGNYINNCFLGPLTFKDTFFGFQISKVLYSEKFGLLFRLAGVFSSYILLVLVIDRLTELFNNVFKLKQYDFSKMILLVYSSIYFGILCCLNDTADRYTLPLVFALILFLISFGTVTIKRYCKVLGLLSLFILGSFSVLGTKDYFSVNTARWKAVEYLTNDLHISIQKIDAGYEANGWLNFSNPLIFGPNKSYWWVHDDTYIVCISPLAGYNVMKTIPFKKYLHNYGNTMYILERDSNISNKHVQAVCDFETIANDSIGFIVSNQIVKIPSQKNISHISHTGKNSLYLTHETGDSVMIHLTDIHPDDYCEMRFWAHSPKLNVRTKVKVFGLQYDMGLEPMQTVAGWTQYKCGFFASSWISDFADNIDIKIIPAKNTSIIIDDVQLMKMSKQSKRK